MSAAPTSAARAKIPVSPKTDLTQAVNSDTLRNSVAKISAAVSCSGLTAGTARSPAESGWTLFHSHHEIAAPAIKRTTKAGASTIASGGLKNTTTVAIRRYMMVVAAMMPADNSGRRLVASFCRLARTTVVAVDE